MNTVLRSFLIFVIALVSVASAAPPSATTNAATNVTSSSAQMNATINPNGLSTSAYFQWGLTTSYGNSTGPGTFTGSSSTNINSVLSGAPPNTTYHYRVVATNSSGTTNGSNRSFTTSSAQAPPSATTNAATNVTSTSAQMNGTINPNGASTSAYFQWGLTTSYGNTTGPGTFTGTSSTSINSVLSGASSNTTYHYRVVATNSGGTTNGSDRSFTTGSPPQTPPSATTNSASNVTSTSAQMNATINPNGASTSAYFQWGLTTSYGNSTAPGTFTGTGSTSINSVLSGATSSTTYHYRVVATNSGGTTNGSDRSFTTSPPAQVPPSATTNAASNVTSSSAQMNATINPNGASTSAYFEWGFTTSYGNSTTPGTFTGTGTTDINSVLSGAPANTTYHYRVVATNSGGTTTGSDRSFTTTANAAPAPEILEIIYPATLALGQWADVAVRVKNNGGQAADGGISVSLPALTGSGDGSFVADDSSSAGSPGYREYTQGTSIAHKSGTSVTAAYMLVEWGDQPWPAGEENWLRFRVQPKVAGSFVVQIRSAMGQSGAGSYVGTPLSGPLDQQGWWVTQRTINVSVDADIRIEPTNLTIGPGAQMAPVVNSDDAALSKQLNSATESMQAPASADTKTVAGQPLKRRRVPVKPPITRLEKGFKRDAVAVTFKDGLTIRARGGNLDDLGTEHLISAKALLASLSKGRWERIDALPEARVEEMRQKAQRSLRREISDLNLQFRFYIPPGLDPAAVIDQLNALDIVELAQAIPQVTTPSPPSYQSNQGYLNAAPSGINALVAESTYPTRGAGIKLADVEYAFNPNHQDLPSNITILGGPLPSIDIQHGTAVLGQIAGKDDGKGIRGIAPDCTLLFSSAGAGGNVEQAVLVAANSLAAGDVLLIELQSNFLPVEAFSLAYDRIVTAVGQGIIVVEAAGNGATNLDDILTDDDSGAIMVGASLVPGGSGTARSRAPNSNYGVTVDLQGWGEKVWTTGYGSAYSAEGVDYYYTDSFSETSSAAPIVAGACVLLQSAYKAETGNVLSPLDVRQILRATGSAQQGNTAQNIGPMPNVSAAIASIIPSDSATSFRIHNDGAAPLTVSSLALNQATSWISFSAQTPFDVPPDSYRTVTVIADYSQAPTGQTVRQIAVRSNDPNEDPYPGGVSVTINTPAPVIYSLTLTANNGTITKNPDSVNYTAGSQVVLTATPANGFQFSGWSGDATGAMNPLTVVMNSNKSVTASFTAIPSNNANLNSLVLSVGSLNPAFASGTTAYAASVSNAVASATATASLADSGATVKINGSSVVSGNASSPISLAVGNTAISVVVTAQNGTTQKTYAVTVTRETYYATWAAANGVTGVGSGPSENFDNDGMNNFLEMASGTDATAAGGGAITVSGGFLTRRGSPTTILGSDLNFRALYGRRKDYLAAGLTYTVQFSADFTTWENSAVIPTVVADDGVIQAVTVLYPSSLDEGGFFRVQVFAQ